LAGFEPGFSVPEANAMSTVSNLLATLVLIPLYPVRSTYSDYESVNECMEGVCKIYEEHLKRLNPNIPSITYDIAQLFDFIDQVPILTNTFFSNFTHI
jgi:hypothetical protein